MTIRLTAMLFSLALLFPWQLLSAQEEASELFSRATGQLLSGQMELSMDVAETDKQGREKSKAYHILMGKFGEVEKIRMVMQKPERARGITIVITSMPDSTGQIEVYTPANGKVRKMEATEQNMARVGSKLYLSTYSSRDIENLEFTLLDPVELEGEACYQMAVKEKGATEGGGARFLISMDDLLIRQIHFLDKEGMQKNITSLSEYQPVDGMPGKVQPMRILAKDLEAQSSTEVRVHTVQSRPDLSEADFTIEIPGN